MDKSIELKKQADQLLSIGNLIDAQNYYTQAIELNPKYSEALVGLGFLFFEQKNYDNAQYYLNRALEQDDKNPDIYFILSEIQEEICNIDDSLKNLYLAIEINPQFEFAHRKLLQKLIQQKDFCLLESKAKNAIKIFPSSAEFIFYLAESYYQKFNYIFAIEEYKKLLLIEPNAFPAHINLGNSYFKLEHYLNAIESYQNASNLDNKSLEPYLGLAKANNSEGNIETALKLYQQCLSINPDNVEANVNLGNILFNKGKPKDAMTYIQKAIKIDPTSITAHHSLGNIYFELNEKEKAIFEYKEVLKIDPNHPIAYLVVTMTGENTNTNTQEYIEKLFDQYAKTFDESLVENLKYNVPFLIQNEFTSFFGNIQKLEILDLGCGTGLIGESLKKSVKSLVGVDLSAKMLQIAEKRNIYTRLEKKEIFEMMSNDKESSYDAIIAADVFIYIGELNLIFSEVNRLMKNKGLFIFSIEALEHTLHKDKHDFYLHESGRYAHSLSYLNKIANKNNLRIKKCETQQIRLEKGKPVIGYIITIEKIN